MGGSVSNSSTDTSRLLLLGDDLILDLVVGGLRDNLLLHQLVLPLVRPAVDDLLGVGVKALRSSSEALLTRHLDGARSRLPLK